MSPRRDPFNQALLSVRERIEGGACPAGRPIVIADEARRLILSTTPIREALCWLGGEGLVERGPAGGFLAPRLDPALLRDRYALRRLYLQTALERGGGDATPQLPDASSAVRRLAGVWRWCVRALGDAALLDAFDRVNSHLNRFAAAEARLFGDIEAEAEAVITAGRRSILDLISAYHDRRMAASVLLTLEAETDLWPSELE